MRIMLFWLTIAISLLGSAESAVGKKAPDNREQERNQRIRYTASWAVEITEGGSKAADAVAKRHGYRNLGKVQCDSRARIVFLLLSERRASCKISF